MWFRNNAQVAEVEIRKVIGAAKTKVLLVDPYFTALGAKLYLPWVTGSGVQNEILTSSKGLREISLTDEGDEMGGTKWAKRELAHLEALSNELNHAVAARRVNSTLVKVMGGDSPAIHDRFLVVDESAWLLGSSLNSFGTRGTMMVELPSPEAVVPELVHVWKDPTSLDMGERIEVLRRQLQEPA